MWVNIRTEDPSGRCRYMIQTRLHIIRECPRYLNQRPLPSTGRNTQLERLIGTEARIKCLLKFITHMKAMDKHKTPGTNIRSMLNRPKGRERRGEGWRIDWRDWPTPWETIPQSPSPHHTHLMDTITLSTWQIPPEDSSPWLTIPAT